MIDFTINYTKIPMLQQKLLRTAKELMGDKYYEATLLCDLMQRVCIDNNHDEAGDETIRIVFYIRTSMYKEDDDNNYISVDFPLSAVNYTEK